MSLFTMDLAHLTFRNVEEFCGQNLPENVRLDYKRELPPVDPQRHVAKMVSSFANTQGGLLLYGVGTKPNSKYPELPPAGMPVNPDFEKRVTRWCIEHIYPPVVPTIGYVGHPSQPDRAFAVVRVELSWLTPHTVEGGTRFYVRRADNSDPADATIAELELLRNRRQAAQELEERHLRDLRERLSPPMRQPLLRTLVVAPQFSSDEAVPWARLRETAHEFSTIGFKERLVQSVLPYSHGVLSVGDPNWVFAVTVRGAFGATVTHGADAADPKNVSIQSLLSWALLAVQGSAILSRAAGYWGNYVAQISASGYGDLPVIDERDGFRDPLGKCIDMKISVTSMWSASDARSSAESAASPFARRILWAFGVHEPEWREETLRSLLRQLVQR